MIALQKLQKYQILSSFPFGSAEVTCGGKLFGISIERWDKSFSFISTTIRNFSRPFVEHSKWTFIRSKWTMTKNNKQEVIMFLIIVFEIENNRQTVVIFWRKKHLCLSMWQNFEKVNFTKNNKILNNKKQTGTSRLYSHFLLFYIHFNNMWYWKNGYPLKFKYSRAMNNWTNIYELFGYVVRIVTTSVFLSIIYKT